MYRFWFDRPVRVSNGPTDVFPFYPQKHIFSFNYQHFLSLAIWHSLECRFWKCASDLYFFRQKIQHLLFIMPCVTFTDRYNYIVSPLHVTNNTRPLQFFSIKSGTFRFWSYRSNNSPWSELHTIRARGFAPR